MKFFKYCYFVVGLWVLMFSYLQLFILPELRYCMLGEEGLSALSSFTPIVAALQHCSSFSLLVLTLLTAFIVLFGLKKGYFVRLYDYLENRKRGWVIVAVIIGLATLPYLSIGNVFIGDAMLQLTSALYLKESILALSYPFWTFYWYMGAAPFAIHGWAHSLLAGIGSIFVEINFSYKLGFYLLHLGSALITYKFVKTATKNTNIAIIAALVYSLSFEHIGRVMIGRSFASLAYFLVPLLFLIYELRLQQKLQSLKAIAIIAIIAGLLVVNHPLNGFFVIVIWLLYAALRTVEVDKKKFKKLSIEVTASLLIAFLLVSFWAVPLLLEKGESSGESKAVDVLRPHAPDTEIIKGMFDWPGKWGKKSMYYLGFSFLALTALGLYYLVKLKKYALPAALAIALILLVVQSPRYFVSIMLIMALSAGYGFAYLTKRINFDHRKLLLIVIAIMILDMVPASIQLGYPDFTNTNEFYKEIEAKHGERVLDLSTDRRTFWPVLVYINNRQETVFGQAIEVAPASLSYSAAISNKAAHEFYDLAENLSEESLNGLYVLGVKKIIVYPEQIKKNPKEVFNAKKAALGLERNLDVIELDEHSLLIAAPKIEKVRFEQQLEKEEGWYLRDKFEERTIDWQETDRILKEMKINRKKGSAERILVKDSDDTLEEGSYTLTIADVKTDLRKVTIKYNLSNDAYVQAAYSYYPFLSVKIDGNQVPYEKTAIHTIAFKSTKGEHTLTVEAQQSGLRKIMFFPSLAAIIIIIIFLRKKQG